MTVLEQIAVLNKVCFGADDWYSDYENLKKYNKYNQFNYTYTKGDKGEVVGYLLYWCYVDCIEGLRSGVSPDYQGRGLGKKLFKKAMKLADKLKLPYWTYSSAYNYKSVSSHVRAGMKIKKVREDEEGLWIDLVYNPK